MTFGTARSLGAPRHSLAGVLRRPPLHLVALLCCGALAGYAALGVLVNPVWPRMLLWFAAAIVAHDVVAFPLYAAADRALCLLRPGPGSTTCGCHCSAPA